MVLGQPIITLTTDFGTADGYVGAVKGVILSVCPHARLIDITHSIAPQNLNHAAFTLYNAVSYFPPDTIHLVVVDPGVGTSRRALALRAGGMFFVAPDNGVLSLVLSQHEPELAIALENKAFWRAGLTSSTFHGRDIFGPAAAHLAAGTPLTSLGSAVKELARLAIPALALRSPHEAAGQVLYLDRFGNAVTNIGVLLWKDDGIDLFPLMTQSEAGMAFVLPRVWCQGQFLPLHRTYGAVCSGTPLAVIGSSGLLEIAVRDGSAAETLALCPGDAVILTGETQI